MNFSWCLALVFLLDGLVSLKKNRAQRVPSNDNAAAKKKGACGPNLLSKPPNAGPITKPNPNAEPKMPNFLALFSGVAVSATMACATETFPPVKPSNIRAAKSKSRLRASAKSRNDIQVPARLITSSGLRPHLSDREPNTGVAKNCATEKEAVKIPRVYPVIPNSLPYE